MAVNIKEKRVLQKKQRNGIDVNVQQIRHNRNAGGVPEAVDTV